MKALTRKFLTYPPKRDILFVLGAGASHPDGVPLQQQILPMIISGDSEQIKKTRIGQQVIQFVDDHFLYNQDTGQFPQLEAVFGFLDYFIQHKESLSSHYPNPKIQEIKEDLIKIIHYIVDLKTDKPSATYHAFWEAIQRNNTNISIITLNYDTLLEQAFDFLFQKCGYIDYCIHFMNYTKLNEVEEFSFWINPREPIQISEDENPVPFKIIKIHGSLNWKYCNCCNQTLLTPWDRKIDLNKGKFLGYTFPGKQEYEYCCPLDGTEFQTLIMPPSYVKSLEHPVISQLLSEASREIRVARKIVFVGYSFSDADIHMKALFKKHLIGDRELIVVNTRNSESLRLKYCTLSRNVSFVDCSFEEMVHNDGKLMEQIFS